MKQDGLVAWALGRLGQGASKAKLDGSGPLDELAQRFGLDALAREILALTWAAEKSLAVAKAAREAAGPSARALTVEVVRDALGQPLDAQLAAQSPLRRHALVTLDSAGPALASSELRLSAGLSARLDGTPLPLDGFAPGVRAARAPIDNSWIERFPANAKLAELIKDRIVAVEPLIVTIDGCGRRDALALALGAAKRFSRGLLIVDGEVLASLGGRWELLAALRREADLESMALVVCQSAALGEAWRALVAPSPAQSSRPPLILLADLARTREVTLLEGLRHQALALNAPMEKIVEAAPREDPYEVIRRQAQRDAERALGVYKPTPEELRIPPPQQPQNRVEPTKVEPAKVDAPKVDAPKVDAPKVDAPKVDAPKVDAAASEASKAEPPKAAPPVDEPPKKMKRSRKAMEHFGADPSDEPPPPPPRPAPVPVPVSAAPVPVDSAATGALTSADPSLTSSAPYLPLSEKPTSEEVAMVARTSPNPQQRVELLNALKGAKTQPVVAALRDNVKSEHPAVRAAAEEGMEAVFGPNWNRVRAVPKPIQTPGAADDKKVPW